MIDSLSSSELKHQLRKYTAALARNPRNPRILRRMGEVLLRLDRRHEGLSCYMNAGQRFMDLEKFPDAVQVFDRVLAMEPGHEAAMKGKTAAERGEIRTVVGGPRRPMGGKPGATRRRVKRGEQVVVVPSRDDAGEASDATPDDRAGQDLVATRGAELQQDEAGAPDRKEPGWSTINLGWESEDEDGWNKASRITQEVDDADVVAAQAEPDSGHFPRDLNLHDTMVDLGEGIEEPSEGEVLVTILDTQDDDFLEEEDDDLGLADLFAGQDLMGTVVELTPSQHTPRPIAPNRVATVRDEPADYATKVQPLPLPEEYIASGRELTFESGQRIFAERDKSNGLALLAQGKVELTKDVRGLSGEVTRIRRLATLGDGSCFGVSALLGDGLRHCTARVLEPSRLRYFTKRQVKELMRSDGKFNKAIRKLYRSRLLDTLLKVSPLLRPLSHEVAQKFIGQCKPRKYSTGDVVFSQGERTGGLYVVLIGRLDVVREDQPGEAPRLLRRLADGDFFGGISLLHDQPAKASVVARGFCQLLRIDPNDFYAFAAEEPDLLGIVEQEADRREKGFSSIMQGAAEYEVGTTVFLLNKKKPGEE